MSTQLKPTRVIAYDERGNQFPSSTGRHHVFQVHPHHYVSVRLVTDDHVPLPPQKALLKLPDGAEHKLRIGSDGILKYEPTPEGLCSLSVEDLGRAMVRFPTVPDDELVIVVRVPPNPFFGDAPALGDPPEHEYAPAGIDLDLIELDDDIEDQDEDTDDIADDEIALVDWDIDLLDLTAAVVLPAHGEECELVEFPADDESDA